MLYIYANIFSDFQCRMCGTCCKNHWQVTVDQACYQRNADLFQMTGRIDEFHQAFQTLKQPGLGEYAEIAKQPQGQCWFLRNDNLCRLHQEAGHEHLDTVCKTFPRYPMDTARGIELTLSFSCPAVLELAGESPMEIIRSEIRPGHIYSEDFVVRIYPQQYPLKHPLHYYFELEQHVIDILQWRSLPMSERIQRICHTVDLLCSSHDDTGSAISRIINHNYEQMAVERHCMSSQDAGDILIENFLVNSIFKKMLYEQGLKHGIAILRLLWDHIQLAANGNAANAASRREQICRAILELEFEYSHHRSRFILREAGGRTQ